MAETCPDCGLPEDLCVCETIAKESREKIKVKVENRKFGRQYTIVEGMSTDVDKEDLARKLKTKFACGGTVKDGRIELQGDHKHRAKEVLVDLGFPEEMIDIQ